MQTPKQKLEGQNKETHLFTKSKITFMAADDIHDDQTLGKAQHWLAMRSTMN